MSDESELKQATGTRRLQTVMFTDIKDFSAMMSADEQSTVELVLEHREVVRARLAEHGGVEHETIGDAFLTLFDSPVNAAKCAIAIQEDLAARNEDQPQNRQVWLRIGLHLGDIIHRDGGIYGDGVNTAARIEGCAKAGGICISEQVRLQIQGRLPLTTELLEDVALKGIAHPPPVYRVVLATERPASGTEKASRSLRYGRQLMMATAALVVLVGVALAINGSRSEAEDSAAAAGSAGAVLRASSGASSAGKPSTAKPPSAAPAPSPAADSAAAAASAARPPAAAAPPPKLAKKRMEAMSETLHKAIKTKMAAALKASGAERVRLLKEALTLDPDNAALAQLLMEAEASEARAAKKARAAAKKRAHAARATHRAVKPAVKRAPKPTATGAAPAIKPRVVED